ncbi:leucine--tRNA ligase, partial [Candidatus Dojkabacteria bacterium]|nr:leucine--tRNA ligase [Candidatus Dojkabacteria bacterium]
YKAVDFSDKPKKYILAEFPYPSGKSIHFGHVMRYTVPEIYSRFLRMRGYNVMFPMGWDAFGLPAENYAVKTGTHPAVLTKQLTDSYRQSMKDIGYGIDWDREVNTTDPKYYKWTQWIFLKFWENGLAELREEPVWWSDKMKTVLAEEEVIKDGEGNLVAERDGSPVRKKMLKQWVLKMPEYAERLIQGLDTIDFPDSIKAAQKNWIGKKVGINITYPINGLDNENIVCFTTRPDTNFGATFVVLAPEHPFVERIINGEVTTDPKTRASVKEYVEQAKNKTDLDRMIEVKDKTGVGTGFTVRNQLNGKDIPVWIADFVLGHFGTGAVVGVPAHDMRDFQFAKKFGIEIIRVVVGPNGDDSPVTKEEQVQEAAGIMINSEFLDGMEIMAAKDKMMDYLEEKRWGERTVTYSLRDWVFSRQRYWGEPIPLIHKEDGGTEEIADTNDPESVRENLPLELPEVPDYNPTDDGLSPIAANTDWVNTVDSEGKPAKRETNTMPNWAGSCWYYLRYTDPNNDDAVADIEKMKYWLPVDNYFGGSEHTYLHLLYSRFWHQFLYDQGAVPTPEPYQWRMNGGILLGEDGRKMSKSVGNVIEPQEKLAKYGADAVRLYITFIGPYDGTFPHNESSLKAAHRLVKNIYELAEKVGDAHDPKLEKTYHKMLKKVTDMAENLKMNTIVSEFMIFVKELKAVDVIPKDVWLGFIRVIAPFAVFTAEELWYRVNGWDEWTPENSVHLQEWPTYDEELVKDDTVEIPVQINGNVRATVEVDSGASEKSVRKAVFALEEVKKWIKESDVKDFRYVAGKIISIR